MTSMIEEEKVLIMTLLLTLSIHLMLSYCTISSSRGDNKMIWRPLRGYIMREVSVGRTTIGRNWPARTPTSA